MMQEELEGIRQAVSEIERRLPASNSHAAIHISGGGALAVLLAMLAIVCLIASVAITWVVLERSRLADERMDAASIKIDTHEAMLTDLYRREKERAK